jgi:hypothetical protein
LVVSYSLIHALHSANGRYAEIPVHVVPGVVGAAVVVGATEVVGAAVLVVGATVVIGATVVVGAMHVVTPHFVAACGGMGQSKLFPSSWQLSSWSNGKRAILPESPFLRKSKCVTFFGRFGMAPDKWWHLVTERDCKECMPLILAGRVPVSLHPSELSQYPMEREVNLVNDPIESGMVPCCGPIP